MASRFWTTSADPSGDQQASYSGADFADVWRAMGEGVISGHSLPALDGELKCSAGGVSTVNVADGAAIVDGIYFESTAVESVNVPAAVGAGNTRIDRIVVRVNWSSYEAKITRIAGTDAASPSAPAITQTTETTYDLPLCQVLVNTSGNVTVTDERTFLAPQVDNSTIEVDSNGDLQVKALGITEGKLATAASAKLVTNGDSHDHVGGDGATLPTGAYGDETVTAAKIQNRTRTFLVEPLGDIQTIYGLQFPDSANTYGYAQFKIPNDFASNMVVTSIILSTYDGNGAFYISQDIMYGSINQSYNTHIESNPIAQWGYSSIYSQQRKTALSKTLTDAVANDYVTIRFRRDATHADDTINGDLYLVGFLVSYTADS